MGQGDEAAPLGRHDLLRVAAADWPCVVRSASCGSTLDDDAAALVTDWGRRGWPVVLRRRTVADKLGALAVGLPLPPALGKSRVKLQIPPRVAWERHPALTLRAAQAHAPASWQAAIAEVLGLAEHLRLEPRVFGALLWQKLTGLPYLHAGSDLDLLWPHVAVARLPALLTRLAAIERIGPPRLDGEILCPAGGVNWRELAGSDDPNRTVLVKGVDAVRLTPVWHLFSEA